MEAPNIPEAFFNIGCALAGIGALSVVVAAIWGLVWVVRHIHFT